MYSTFKIQIYPTPDQKTVLWVLSERCRLLYNFALTERRVIWEQEKDLPKKERKLIRYNDQQNALPALKKRYPEYAWVFSKTLQMTLKRLDSNYKSFFALLENGDKGVRPPKYRAKDRFFTLSYNQWGYKYTENTLFLSHKHPSGIPLHFALDFELKGDIKQVELFQDYKKRWFVAVTCDIPVKKEHYDNGLYQAFDPGIDNIVSAVNIQGKFLQIPNKRPDKYWRSKIAEVQSKRDHCKKYTPRWQWYNRKMYRMIRKEANQRNDFQHKISKVVVTHTKANTLIIGKPGVKDMASNNKKTSNPQQRKAQKTLNYSLQNTGFMTGFIEKVKYKAEKYGKRVIPLNEDNTTQVCCDCGDKRKRPLSERTIICSNCENQLDRDENSAVNHMVKFLLEKDKYDFLLQQPSVNEELFLQRWKGFLRHTAKRETRVFFNIGNQVLKLGGLVESNEVSA